MFQLEVSAGGQSLILLLDSSVVGEGVEEASRLE